jgi:hypothetical protein
MYFSGLPPLAVINKGEVKFDDVVDLDKQMTILRCETEPPTVFAINRNLFVEVKILNCKSACRHFTFVIYSMILSLT